MLFRLLLFFACQLFLIGGGFWVLSGLLKRDQLLTIWGALISTWYAYLLVWYGPTSIFGVLGANYVVEAETHPWWLRVDMLVPSLTNSILLTAIPLILNFLFLAKRFPFEGILLTRLEPVLADRSCLWFGLLGTVAQIYSAMFFGDTWLQSQFDFGSLSLLQKSALSGFFIFTVGPQVSLLGYRCCRSVKIVKTRYLDIILLGSILAAIYAFASFGQRTYILFEIVFLGCLFFSISGRYKLAIVGLLPFALFLGYAVTSMQARISNVSPHPVDIVSVAGRRLVDDLAYRSHIANDGVVIGSRLCVLNQLGDLGLNEGLILPVEFASGFPRQIRQLIPYDISSARLETLVGNCYRKWFEASDDNIDFSNVDLDRVDLTNIDLTDSKGQYFLVIFGQFWAPLMSTLFWLVLLMIYIGIIVYLFYAGLHFVAFAVPASIHFLVLATTPGEVFVVVKAMIPYLLIFSIISFYRRGSIGSVSKKIE